MGAQTLTTALLRASALVLAFNLLAPPIRAEERRYAGLDTLSRIKFYDGITVDSSETVAIDGRMLKRWKDYRPDYILSTIQLYANDSGGANGDTLTVTYTPLPIWLKKSYGFTPHIFTAQSLASNNFNSSTATQAGKNSIGSNYQRGSNPNSPGSFASIGRSSKASNSIELKGTKRFAINTRNSSGVTYDQSLDLEVSGELTPGLFVSGALTDRSYDPSYGGVNGRISELDKLRLTFTSKKFMGEIGDLSLRDSRWNSPHRGKKLSGVATQIETGAVKSSLTFGRPRGERESVSFTGQTGRQGPYRLRPKKISPLITPGSVEAWVDGARMDEGANKDFVVDYSFGEITFTPSRPIDSRSRIEVDFDPLESSYKKEYLSVSSVALSEGKSSQIEISFRREGDIKDQFQNASNPGASQSALLFAGDDPQKAIISGVKPDSAGAYVYDLEGNLNYVGAGLGDFSVAFSPVGSANGDYIFLGGDHYEYAGAGQGDFLPIIHLVAPERRELFKLNARSTLGSKISYHLGGQFSSVDLNQISALDDFDNKGGMYSIGLDFNQSANLLQQRTSGAKVSTSKIQSGWSARVDFRMREANFATSERINTADFGRNFLIPSDFKRNSEEKLTDFSLSRSLGRHVRISTSARRLSYAQGFEANSGELSGLIKSEAFESETRFVMTESDYSGESTKRYGKSRRFDHTSQLRVSRSVLFGVTVNHDNRQNNYSETLAGRRYNELILSGTIHGLTAAISTRRDDTLEMNWRSSFTRDRISIRGGMRYSFATMESQILFQRIGEKGATDNQRLVQTRWKFFPRVQKRDVVVSYKLSDEARSERALRFVRVTQGFGTHSLVDSVYLPDPDGDFIQLEENLSYSSAVKFGDKGFSWRERFSKGEIRVSSRVSEELLDLYSRDISWFLPVFWSGADKLLRGDRVISLDARLFPQIGGYGISVSASQRNRTRRIVEETRRKDERSISGTARQVSKGWRAEERLTFFERSADEYYQGGGLISGWKLTGGMYHRSGNWEYGAKLGYRLAHGNQTGSAESQQARALSVSPEINYSLPGAGRASLKTDFYYQTFSGELSSTSFAFYLTDNRFGRRGLILNLNANYGVTSQTRFQLGLSGRFSDTRRSRIFGKMELIAQL